MTARRRHHVAAAVGLLVGGCSQAPVAVRAPDPAAVPGVIDDAYDTTTTSIAEPVAEPVAEPATPIDATATEAAEPVEARTSSPKEPAVMTPASTVPHNHEPAPMGARTVRGDGPGSGRCGGDLPPCSVMERESGGDPNAVNATGCGGRGCYGKWQADPRTSQGQGYPGVMTDYSEAEQDEFARGLWRNGAGCSHWNAC